MGTTKLIESVIDTDVSELMLTALKYQTVGLDVGENETVVGSAVCWAPATNILPLLRCATGLRG